jgi:hypothetical protein
VRIRLLENDGAVETIHFSDVSFGEDVGLKINNHVQSQ